MTLCRGTRTTARRREDAQGLGLARLAAAAARAASKGGAAAAGVLLSSSTPRLAAPSPASPSPPRTQQTPPRRTLPPPLPQAGRDARFLASCRLMDYSLLLTCPGPVHDTSETCPVG